MGNLQSDDQTVIKFTKATREKYNWKQDSRKNRSTQVKTILTEQLQYADRTDNLKNYDVKNTNLENHTSM